MTFSLEVRKIDDVAVFDMNGRLCVGDPLLLLRNAVKRTLDEGTNKVVINLGGVSFMDSSGLGELITAHSSMQNGGGSMNLLNPSKRMKELLQMTKLDHVFQSFDDEVLSVQELRSQPPQRQ
jgi:anti-sigma B factor antagonist